MRPVMITMRATPAREPIAASDQRGGSRTSRMGKAVSTGGGRAAPPNFAATLEAIRTMRADKTAPVDTMGCHMLAAPDASPRDQRLQVLISLMLSSQTRDEVTAAAMRRLHVLPLSLSKLLTMDADTLADLIRPVGFYRQKAKYILRTAALLATRPDQYVPRTLEELQALPGVGPKMACLAMQNAWGESVGIGVDVHVHRICNRLGWVHTKDPEGTRAALEDWLPRDLWSEINPLLVGFGQTVCLPVKPRCGGCLLRDSCPSSTCPTVPRGAVGRKIGGKHSGEQ